jgi:uracil-DNA glycosylase
MLKLLQEIKNCTVCEQFLSSGCRPIMTASKKSKIVIIGQAPGKKVHESGIPWDDTSGDTLRTWLGVDKKQFYDTDIFALLPMGFCYPGKGKSGDLAPRPECAPLWHQRVLGEIEKVELVILIGLYAQRYYLADTMKSTLTETVKSFKSYAPEYSPLPHPSPRNNIWMAKNKWFKTDIVPALQERVYEII